MIRPRLSVVIPTRNRQLALMETLASFSDQTLSAAEYEIIVVDDGSTPPVVRVAGLVPCQLSFIRLEGRERSGARNEGVRVANGEIVVFVDDDISVGRKFLAEHRRAHEEWADALAVGQIELPATARATPFGSFRQALEKVGVPEGRGIVQLRNLCSAANASICRERFVALGGFDETLTSAEDQDLALRHTAAGGRIVFVPEALGLHRDEALDIQSYGRRVERGSEGLVNFCRRHPEWPDNVARDRVNGPIQWSDPWRANARKLAKQVLATKPALQLVFALVARLERSRPSSLLLGRAYRLVVGVHMFRGYRRGLMRPGSAPRFLVTELRQKV